MKLGRCLFTLQLLTSLVLARHLHADNMDGSQNVLLSEFRDLGQFRNKRAIAANGSSDLDDPQKITTYETGDQNDQMALNIVGNGNPLVFAFTRMQNYSKMFTSHLYVSHDHGVSFRDVAAEMVPSKGIGLKLHSSIKNSESPNHYVFTDIENGLLFTTSDGCRTFSRTKPPFIPTEILIDPKNSSILVGRDNNDSMKRLWVSLDFGQRWQAVEELVDAVVIGKEVYDLVGGRSSIFIRRVKPGGRGDVFRSTSYFMKGEKELLINNVEEFELFNEFIFATKREMPRKGESSGELSLWVSYQRKPFVKATFGSQLKIVDYFVSNATGTQLIVAITFANNRTDLYFSSPGTTAFSMSLENVLFYHPSPNIGKFSAIKEFWSYPKPFAEVHHVRGLRGVYIVNQLTPDHDRMNNIGNSVSKISYDNGATWGNIPAPRLGFNGKPMTCESGKDCSIHLLQTFPIYSTSFNRGIFSSESAPGMILAAGTVGDSQMSGEDHGIFVSLNGGFTWRETLRGTYKFAVGDHGGLLVAVNDVGRTNELLYSINEGITWETYKFSLHRVRVVDVLTEPGEESSVFTLFGTLKDTGNVSSVHEWMIIRVNLTHVFNGTKCQEQDFKEWSFEDFRARQRCLMGRKIKYQKKLATKKCLLGNDFRRRIKIENCTCQIHDYECDLGFIKSNTSATLYCIKDPSSTYDLTKIPSSCSVGSYWTRSKGYRKIPMDTCAEGVSKRFDSERIPCPWPEGEEFLLTASASQISRILLGKSKPDVVNITQILDLKGEPILGMDFDISRKCLYYSHANPARIMRSCFNGKTSRTIIAEMDIKSPISVSFDWISRILYWLDDEKGTIEAVKVDATSEGRMRRTILDSKDMLSNAMALDVYPPAGVMFWTQLGIYRANLDGSEAQQWASGVTPYAIAVDYRRKSLLYSDSLRFQIGEALSLDSRFPVRKGLLIDPINWPTVIAAHKDWIYYTGFEKTNLTMVNRNDRTATAMAFADVKEAIHYLKAFPGSYPSASNPCAGNQTVCPKLCLSMPNSNFSCLCPDGFQARGSACLCPNGTQLNAEGHCSAEVSSGKSCRSDQFDCGTANGPLHCIPKIWECDGDADCPNGNDEEDCDDVPNNCGPDTFRCADGRCIHAAWICDNDFDCTDHSDELNCTTNVNSCKSTTDFRCADDSGKCVPGSYVCDLQEDCIDGSDEANCTFSEMSDIKCSNENEFKCTDEVYCLPISWKCDGEADCADASDEFSCGSNSTCLKYQFACKSEKKCILSTWRCDGMADCMDNSDEENCGDADQTTNSSKSIVSMCNNASVMLPCRDGTCVPLTWKCDGFTDCLTGADEEGCSPDLFGPAQSCPKGTILCVSVDACIDDVMRCDGYENCPGGEDEHHCVCGKDEFNCGNGTCIADGWICDNDVDCASGADEATELCANKPKCETEQYKCRISGGCIDSNKICDGVKDCVDGSDEFGCLKLPERQGCKSEQFQCATGSVCVPLNARCNKTVECTDGSDEASCGRLDPALIRGFFVDRNSITSKSARVWWHVSSSDKVLSDTFTLTISTRDRKPIEYPVSGTNFTLTNLEPYREYKVTLSYPKLRAGDRDRSVTIRTKMDKPSPPRNVKIEQVSVESPVLSISWQAPQFANGELQKFIITAFSELGVWSQTVPAPNCYVTMNDPAVNVTYFVYVKVTSGTKEDPTLFESDPSETANHTVHADVITSPVRNLKFDPKNDTYVILTWEKPMISVAIQGYFIYYTVMEVDTRLETQGLRVDISGLAPGKNYKFYVRPYNGFSQGPTAELEVVTTGTPMLPPQRLQAVTMSASSVQLTWQPPGNQNDGTRKKNLVYGIYYGLGYQEIMNEPARANVTNAVQFTVTNLLPCRNYIFMVRVTGPETYSDFSDAIIGKTGMDPAAPPVNLKVSKTLDRQFVNISWDVPCFVANISTIYVLNLTDIMAGSSRFPQTGNLAEPHRVERVHVRTGARYSVSVGAYNSHHAVIYSPAVYFTTPAYESPEKFYVTVQNGSFLLTWSLPKSVAKLARDKDMRFYFNVSMSKDGNPPTFHKTDSSPFLLSSNATIGVYSFQVAVADKEQNLGERSPLFEVRVETEYHVKEEQTSFSATMVIPILVLIMAVILACFVAFRRYRNNKRSETSFTTTRFHNTPYGNEFMEIDEEDMPVFRAFADDEPLVNE